MHRKSDLTAILIVFAFGLVTRELPAEEVITQPIRTFGMGTLEAVAYSPDGQHIATCGSNGAFLWEVATGHWVRKFMGHTGIVRSVAFSPDGTRLLTGSYDDTAKLWDVATGQRLLWGQWSTP